MGKLIDLTGQKFGMLTVVCRSENRGKEAIWKCRCDCGKEINVRSAALRLAGQYSCGCQGRINAVAAMTKANTKHGGTQHRGNERLYSTWLQMKKRCNNPHYDKYDCYGGRGIKVCPEWEHDYGAFRAWALGNGYENGLTIDRIDVNDDYCPENCRWITQKEQMNNTRRTVYLEYNGEKRPLQEWAEITGIPAGAIYQRINTYHYAVEDALTKPLKSGLHKKSD